MRRQLSNKPESLRDRSVRRAGDRTGGPKSSGLGGFPRRT